MMNLHTVSALTEKHLRFSPQRGCWQWAKGSLRRWPSLSGTPSAIFDVRLFLEMTSFSRVKVEQPGKSCYLEKCWVADVCCQHCPRPAGGCPRGPFLPLTFGNCARCEAWEGGKWWRCIVLSCHIIHPLKMPSPQRFVWWVETSGNAKQGTPSTKGSHSLQEDARIRLYHSPTNWPAKRQMSSFSMRQKISSTIFK